MYYVIDDTTIFEESEISVVINNVYWRNKMLCVLLANFHIFVPTYIISIEVNSWTFIKQVLITSKLFVIPVLDFKLFRLQFPDVLTEVIVDSVLEIVMIGEVLFRVCEDKPLYSLEPTNEGQLWDCVVEQYFTYLLVQL